jgi:hypothetical protein
VKSATVWIDPQTRRIAIKTSEFDAFFNNTLKGLLKPPASRGFDFARKIWLVDQSHMDALQKIFAQLSYNVVDGTLPQEVAPAGGSPFHDLLCDLKLEVLRKVYRVIALECHPDRNPERRDECHSLMTKVNEAWARIQGAKT